MGRTTIPCDDGVRDRLSSLKREGETWDEFLNRVIVLLENEGYLTQSEFETGLEGLRSDLLTELPEEVATELRQK